MLDFSKLSRTKFLPSLSYSPRSRLFWPRWPSPKSRSTHTWSTDRSKRFSLAHGSMPWPRGLPTKATSTAHEP